MCFFFAASPVVFIAEGHSILFYVMDLVIAKSLSYAYIAVNILLHSLDHQKVALHMSPITV